MNEIDKIALDFPFYGRRRITEQLKAMGYNLNQKRVARLMQQMGIQAIYPKPKKGRWEKRYGKFEYLLKGLSISKVNEVWATDITYIPVNGGFLYLAAILDLYSRYVIAWEISNSLESDFCLKVAQKAFDIGAPRIFNSDQGVQYTSHKHVEFLREQNVEISMSGRGRCWDNIIVERFWRTLKYEEVYIKCYDDSLDAVQNIGEYISVYNSKRLHSSIGYRTPEEVFTAA